MLVTVLHGFLLFPIWIDKKREPFCVSEMTSARSRIQRHLIRRKRKLTILLRADRTHKSPPNSSSPADDSVSPNVDFGADSKQETQAEVVEIYDFSTFVSTCVTHWTIWQREAQEERGKSVELVTQYPTPSNLEALLDLECLCLNMEKVRFLCNVC